MPMYCTEEMAIILAENGYTIYIYNDGTECDVFFDGRLLHTLEGTYALYNWMCDCELL